MDASVDFLVGIETSLHMQKSTFNKHDTFRTPIQGRGLYMTDFNVVMLCLRVIGGTIIG